MSRNTNTHDLKISSEIVKLGGLEAVVNTIRDLGGHRQSVADRYGKHINTIHNWYKKYEAVRVAFDYFKADKATERRKLAKSAIEKRMAQDGVLDPEDVYGALMVSYGSITGASEELGCEYVTLVKTIERYPDLKEAVSAGKELGEGRLEDLVYSAALGSTSLTAVQRDMIKFYTSRQMVWNEALELEHTGNQNNEPLNEADSVASSVPDFRVVGRD